MGAEGVEGELDGFQRGDEGGLEAMGTCSGGAGGRGD
jgi:hypothetical protein